MPRSGVLRGLWLDAVRRGHSQMAERLGLPALVWASALVCVAMALYLARDPGVYRDGLVSLVPPKVRQVARAIVEVHRGRLQPVGGEARGGQAKAGFSVELRSRDSWPKSH